MPTNTIYQIGIRIKFLYKLHWYILHTHGIGMIQGNINFIFDSKRTSKEHHRWSTKREKNICYRNLKTIIEG